MYLEFPLQQRSIDVRGLLEEGLEIVTFSVKNLHLARLPEAPVEHRLERLGLCTEHLRMRWETALSLEIICHFKLPAQVQAYVPRSSSPARRSERLRLFR